MNSCIDKNYKTIAGEVCWSAPSNIALVKYWGKWGDQLPRNPSISLTLENARSKTMLRWQPKQSENSQIEFLFHGKVEEKFALKIQKYFKKMETHFSFLEDFDFEVHSENTFPHSAGIASSASSMAALALCLGSMEQKVLGKDLDSKSFMQQASKIARLGSGSASRSVFNEVSLWGKSDALRESCDEYAVEVDEYDSIFSSFRDAILIVDPGSKPVSSSQGHDLMNEHPYAETRFSQARENTVNILKAMKKGDLESFGEIVEREALELHSLMGTSNPSFILMKPGTLSIIEKVREFRKSTGHPLYFTLDAGPNVHLLYPENIMGEVEEFIKSKLLTFLDNGRWLADRVGKGPRIE